MRQGTYLNVILTVNAVLLTALVWTQIVGTPLAETASAQNRSYSPKPPTIPNASKQRDAMVKTLNTVNTTLNDLKRRLETGVKVEVTNLDEIDVGG